MHLKMAADSYDENCNENKRLKRITEKPRNSLFFTPQVSKVTSPIGSKEEQQKYLENDNDNFKNDTKKSKSSMMLPPKPVDMEQRRRDRLIQPENTRFPNQHLSSLLKHSSSKVDKPSFSASDTDTDLDSSPLPFEEVRKRAKLNKTNENETFVDMTPLIRPGDDEESSPIVTWGNIVATPLIIRDDGGESNSDVHEKRNSINIPSFKIKQERERDRIARKAEENSMKRARMINQGGTSILSMNSKAASSKHKKSKSLLRKPSSSLRERSSSLTPAAQSLFAKSLGKKDMSSLREKLSNMPSSSKRANKRSKDGKFSGGFGDALRSSSFTRQRQLSSTRSIQSSVENTPSLFASREKLSKINYKGDFSETGSKKSTTKRSNLTDGLLYF